MTTPTTPNAAERPSAAQIIAAELARIDGYDPEDQHGGLYDLRWSGGPNPEPQGDAWSMDYLPKAERIAAAIDSHHPAESVSAEPVAYERRWRYVSGSWSVWCRCDQAAFDAKEVMRDCGVEQPTEYRALYLHPQPSAPGAVSDEDVLVAQLRGRALFLRKLGRVKSPSLMERAADALESFAKRSAAPPAQAVSVPEPGYLYALLISIGTFAQGLEGARFEGRPIRDCISDVIGQLAGEEVSTAPAAATREGKE